ncbi:hypothetical protein [Streptomyces johnsoniae]|uniref:Uncharacterized protein n=1 Tax=Streptomyces johnsoniae TaxID=3075532 RepID=A0ABU2RYB1_9ACTN|nr:hypothetical protein [Streptomyces sp. DSM 41886]MDT0441700.1 hypothetical protein [Streptomyces sp. DSM 41886]
MTRGTGVQVAVEVNAATVRRGDQLMIGGQVYTISDLTSMQRGVKRLHFTSGETFTLHPATVLWAARRTDPRRAARRL